MTTAVAREWLQYRFLLQIGLLLIVAGMTAVFLDLANQGSIVEEFVLTRARAHFRDIVLTRRWNAGHGGVYVEKRAGIESNPYLQDPDITATNGKTYTLRNPALMTREISELAARDGDYRFHITSLQLKNPDNAADDWERAALAGFAAGEKERFAAITSGDRSEFRYMAPLLVETACLRCHQDMDYRVGDVRGGISVRFDITPLLLRQQQHAWVTGIAVLLTMAGLFLLARAFASRMSQRMQRLSRRHEFDVSREHEQTRQLLAKHETILQNALVGITYLKHRRVVSCNRRFEEIFGYGAGELSGQSTECLYASRAIFEAVGQRAYANCAAGRNHCEEMLLQRKDGQTFWGVLNGRAIDPAYPHEGSIWIFADISERRAAEEEVQLIKQQLEEHQEHLEDLVKRRTAELTSALAAAKIADQVKDAFLANVSHELRTPLNAVIGLSALALQGSTNARQRQYLEKVGDAGQTLLAIINDLLDLTRIASGEMRLEAQPFSLRQTAARVFSVIGHRAAGKGLRLEAQIDERLPEGLVGDSLRIEQILLNLLNNSIKFTEAGGILLRIIVEHLDAQRANLLLEVEDSGIGMSENEIAHIYRPFVQADPSITRKFGGSGLGLAICKQLVEGMHGSIEVSSQPGDGTCFGVRLTLPLATESDLPDCQEAPDGQSLPTHYHDARVLVVDDQPLNREIVFDLLASVGIVPRLAENGLEAIGILSESGPGAFDLVLMDIQMPVIDGLTATRRIRALPGFATLPIAAMTAHTMEHEKQMYLDEGMNDHLGKPFALPSFFALLARWLAHRADAPPVPTAPVATATSNGDGELPAIDGLDASAARQRFAGNGARYRYWLREFVGDSADFIARLDALLCSREYAAARQVVHAFKGRAGTLGMTELHDLAATLDQFLRASESDSETESNLDSNSGSAIRQQLVQSIECMRVRLQAALGPDRQATTVAAARPEGPLPPAIAALLPLLEAADGGSAAAIAACLAELPNRDWQAPLQAALAKAEGFDFEAARQIIAEVIWIPT
ncbi:MAG TPA: ATP-binding protein [Accumulibacter sp.]|nr:ATP-binding protein [Accumulibacter sp.]